MSYDIPKTQKAAVKVGSGETATVEVRDVPVPDLLPGQILLKINYTGLCASDKSLLQDEWGASGLSMQPAANGIAGHEGAGIVVKTHESVKHLWRLGDRAGIKFIASVCNECEACETDHDELRCARNLSSGVNTPGTFQEYVATDARYASKIPEGVKDEEAGPIMCGGVTAYTALKKSEVRPGQWVVISGSGGGLGHFAVQYAKAMGMRVIGIDGGDEKKELSLRLGAEHFIDFTKIEDVTAEVIKLTNGGASGVTVFGVSKEAYATAPYMLRAKGRMVCVAMPKGGEILASAMPIWLISKDIAIVGSAVGTKKDTEEALDFTARGLVHPILIHGSLHDLNDFVDKMKQGKLPGRAVLKIAE